MYSISEAKDYLRKHFEKGCACPVCGQHVQLYSYKLFASSALALVDIYKLGGDWHHIKEFAEARAGKPRAPHFAELRFWGLVEAKTNVDPTKKSSGYWRITDKGKQFVLGSVRVESRILVYNNKFQGFANGYVMVGLRDVLGNTFDYSEIVGYSETPLVLDGDERAVALSLFN